MIGVLFYFDSPSMRDALSKSCHDFYLNYMISWLLPMILDLFLTPIRSIGYAAMEYIIYFSTLYFKTVQFPKVSYCIA
ncbi:hypothetical protein SETIT_3G292800v2 [Setaria italica]|uniref:Uncharacterized protein n=2 Tax=Setaria italica TaxID=4555 RepID=A0A368QK33_SETIT|nr:hypothetical protein SETIT_3G292800v2 [Setaria italica]RCV18337.1 hypothetical protein SETIT_3G292800v2 [Setaria italica]